MATATVTLTTTTLSQPVEAGDGAILVASTANMLPGTHLYIDRELMNVISLGIGSWVNVKRGVDATGSSRHAGGATITLGRADQFYNQDPMGLPLESVAVQPWINVRNGQIWVPQGDEAGPGVTSRYWVAITTTYGIGAVGIRTAVASPSYSGSTNT